MDFTPEEIASITEAMKEPLSESTSYLEDFEEVSPSPEVDYED